MQWRLVPLAFLATGISTGTVLYGTYGGEPATVELAFRTACSVRTFARSSQSLNTALVVRTCTTVPFTVMILDQTASHEPCAIFINTLSLPLASVELHSFVL